jgi:hypothetical protein
MSGLLRRIQRAFRVGAGEFPEGRAGVSAETAAPHATPDPPAGPEPLAEDPRGIAGLDPLEPPSPTVWRRGPLRRRLRYLRRARELMLRDLGGLLYEVHRTGGGKLDDHAPLLGAKVERLAALDQEAHELERILGTPRGAIVTFEPGIGGACPACGTYFAADAHYCAHCGAALTTATEPDAEATQPVEPRALPAGSTPLLGLAPGAASDDRPAEPARRAAPTDETIAAPGLRVDPAPAPGEGDTAPTATTKRAAPATPPAAEPAATPSVAADPGPAAPARGADPTPSHPATPTGAAATATDAAPAPDHDAKPARARRTRTAKPATSSAPADRAEPAAEDGGAPASASANPAAAPTVTPAPKPSKARAAKRAAAERTRPATRSGPFNEAARAAQEPEAGEPGADEDPAADTPAAPPRRGTRTRAAKAAAAGPVDPPTEVVSADGPPGDPPTEVIAPAGDAPTRPEPAAQRDDAPTRVDPAPLPDDAPEPARGGNGVTPDPDDADDATRAPGRLVGRERRR